ncbi:MAG: GNAT family N-acetyltransferase, partial [Pseudomonadota bacterium]
LWPGSEWPTDLTLEQNLIDLGWHQKEFQSGNSFAYTVVELDESRVIGCVYIYPTRKVGFDAEVYLWTRPPEQVSNINEAILRETVRQWLKKVWPFESPIFPGSDISWEAWSAITEAKR